MRSEKLVINGRVWEWEGKGSWHFVTIEKPQAEKIKNNYPWPRRGFGSIPVNITIGKTPWKTSVFPEKNGSFLLPIKKEIRDIEGIKKGDSIKIVLSVIS